MNAWTHEITRILDLITGRPENTMQLTILLILGAVTSAFVFLKAAKLLKFAMAEGNRSIISWLIAVVVPLVTAAAANLYLVPTLEGTVRSLAAPAAGEPHTPAPIAAPDPGHLHLVQGV